MWSCHELPKWEIVRFYLCWQSMNKTCVVSVFRSLFFNTRLLQSFAIQSASQGISIYLPSTSTPNTSTTHPIVAFPTGTSTLEIQFAWKDLLLDPFLIDQKLMNSTIKLNLNRSNCNYVNLDFQSISPV